MHRGLARSGNHSPENRKCEACGLAAVTNKKLRATGLDAEPWTAREHGDGDCRVRRPEGNAAGLDSVPLSSPILFGFARYGAGAFGFLTFTQCAERRTGKASQADLLTCVRRLLRRSA